MVPRTFVSIFEDTVSANAVRDTGIFDYAAIQRLVRGGHKARRINAGYQLWALLTLFLWLKKWNIETGGIARSGHLDMR